MFFSAEANFKAFVSLIPDIPEFIMENEQKKPTHVKVESLLSDFLATLLILPVGFHYIQTFIGWLKFMPKSKFQNWIG